LRYFRHAKRREGKKRWGKTIKRGAEKEAFISASMSMLTVTLELVSKFKWKKTCEPPAADIKGGGGGGSRDEEGEKSGATGDGAEKGHESLN